MLPILKNYTVWPAVIQTGKENKLTITALGRTFLFFENEEYDITVITVDADEADYYYPKTYKKLKVRASAGVLRFSFTPEGEGEHLIFLDYKEKRLQEFQIYSVAEDLYRLRPLKGDFHSHTYRSDGTIDPAALAGYYREQGYDFFSLTDHNRFWPGEEIDETFAGVATGFTRLNGEEVHAPDCPVHILHNGGTSSVADVYWTDKERFDREIAEYNEKVPEDIPDRYRDRYARIMWAVDNIHAVDGLATFVHPFWKPGQSKINNVCEEFARILIGSGMFDALELMGDGGGEVRNSMATLWGELRACGLRIPVVGSSDVHRIGTAGQSFSNLFTICFAERNESGAIIAAVRNGLTVAVEATGYGYDRSFHCYGSMRLVSYAQYLLRNYFPGMQSITEGEGTLMRKYAVGECEKEPIEAIAKLAEDFSLRFFGKKDPVLPTAEMLEFEHRRRERQLQGPSSRGGRIYGLGITRQI